jgi:hypothetical protein
MISLCQNEPSPALGFQLWCHIIRLPSRAKPIEPLAGVRLALRGVRFDSTKARRELGLPGRPLRETLIDCVA